MNRRIIRLIAYLVIAIVGSFVAHRAGSNHSPAAFSPTAVQSSPAAPSSVSTASVSSTSMPALGAQTKFSSCVIRGQYPDSACTPGAVISSATPADICVSGYASRTRDVPTERKHQAYKEYGITSYVPDEYEIDHLVPLSLGGSNDLANLWPEAAAPQPGFHEKDTVEVYLHLRVCSGAMPLAEAQKEIATDWYAIYLKIRK